MPLFFRTFILIAVALAVAACAGLGTNAPGKTRPEFTRLCFNGEAQGEGACTGTLVANTAGNATGSVSTDWACTRDETTHLIWSLESGNGDWATYAKTTLPDATNAANRCGFGTGWRLPTRQELQSIVRGGRVVDATVDAAYFPRTLRDWYWTRDTYASFGSSAPILVYGGGDALSHNVPGSYYVRLVRSAP